MELNLEGIKLSITKDHIESICNKVESKITKENQKRWDDIASETIYHKAHEAGRTSETRNDDDLCHGLADVTPRIMKEYVKLFVKESLIELFCQDS